MLTPKTTLRLDGPMGERVQANLEHWLLPAPSANPGMLEMLRLRDRDPHPVIMPWAGEFFGKYLISAVQARRMTDDPRLDARLRDLIAEFISLQADDGYIGPFRKKDRLLGQWDLWGHYHCMLGLWMWYEDTGDRAALDCALRAADLICNTFLDTDKRVYDAGSYEENMAVIHVLGILYRETANERYLRMMREIEADWEKPGAGDHFRQAVDGVEFWLTPRPRWESLHDLQGLGELALITGDPRYRQALLHYWYGIRASDVHNTGAFSTNEGAIGNPFTPGAIETCCTVAWIAFSVDALLFSGDADSPPDSKIADAIELATWNGMLGAQHPTGRWWTYNTPMDGWRESSAHTIVFQAAAGRPELNCCSVNAPRALGAISEWALTEDVDGLFVNYYGPGEIAAETEVAGSVRLTQETDYPADGKVRIRLGLDASKQMAIRLRIPEWSKATRARVAGEEIDAIEPGKYLTVSREWQDGDTIDLELDFSPWFLPGDDQVAYRTSVYLGPLLLAVDQHFTTAELADLPSLDIASLPGERITTDARFTPLVLLRVQGEGGRDLVLCDFATAGAHGTSYVSWLPVVGAGNAALLLRHPRPGASIDPWATSLEWGGVSPDANYVVRVATDAAMQDIVHEEQVERGKSCRLQADIEGGRTYYWQVSVLADGSPLPSENGPWHFVADATKMANRAAWAAATAQGEKPSLISASLDGAAKPEIGALLEETGVVATADRFGRAGKALFFNGSTARLRYALPLFPTEDYTLSVWYRAEGVTTGLGPQYGQIVSCWAESMDDPLRLVVSEGALSARIEGDGLHIASGPAVENGVWRHAVVVKRSDALELYLDGEMAGSGTAPKQSATKAVDIGIGDNPHLPRQECFQGAIDDLLFGAWAMSPEEVRELHDQQSVRP